VLAGRPIDVAGLYKPTPPPTPKLSSPAGLSFANLAAREYV